MISHEQREAVIIATLQALDAVHPRGLTTQSLMTPLKLSGLAAVTSADVESLLADLVESGKARATASEAAAEVTRYTRTEEGRAFLRKNGF